ncbi:MAG: putative oxygen-independent coproporphyrinogen III oxidase [Alteromonadaceae bacterium]
MILPPLSLYIHIPWCVQKCPYCDFNSHALKQAVPESVYVQHLLDDLRQDLAYVQGRKLNTIFIGGGTPSLFSAQAIDTLLKGVQKHIPFADDIEITMEANPGSVEAGRFAGYRQAGVNRISIGVQSFQADKLTGLGRIHNSDEAINAAKLAHQIKLNSFNLDLMHGLPDQSIEDALFDLSTAIALAPPHLSWYQLTIEPNTLFHSKPPKLPQDEQLWDIQQTGHELLKSQGYQQYEISAYAQTGQQCRHNLNYWRFGDYLGIGCEAHGKITLPGENKVIRTSKVKHPKGYMNLTKPYLNKLWTVEKDEQAFEYFMNRLRLVEAFDREEIYQYTALTPADIETAVSQAIDKALLTQTPEQWQISQKGMFYLNDLLELFV